MTIQSNDQKSKDIEKILRKMVKAIKDKIKNTEMVIFVIHFVLLRHTGQEASGSDDKKYSWTDKYFHADMSYWGKYHETWIDVSSRQSQAASTSGKIPIFL